jgi:hypothetical protein
MTIDLERLAVDADYWDEVAPEGATHFMYSEKFVKWVDGVEWEFYAFSDRVWKEAFCDWSLQDYINRGDGCVTAKPAAPKSHPTDTQPAESGAQISAEWENGIPPAGWHGECTWGNKENSHECVILPDLKIAINFYTSWSVDQISQLEGVEFRPIRSQAERERKELATFLEDYHLEMGSYWCPEKEADYILSSYDVAKKAKGES